MAIPNQYQKILRSKIASAIGEARAVSDLTHQGVKGSIVEVLISKLFEPLLPANIGAGTGQIVESFRGIQSNQIDIIIYDKSILPPILTDQKLGIFPVESVLYTIEVKTSLNSKELKTAHNSAKHLDNSFVYRSGLEDEKHQKPEKLRSVVFALNSDLTGNNLTEAERYKKYIQKRRGIYEQFV